MRVAVALGVLGVLVGVVGVWAYTGDRTQWEVLLLRLPQSVEWFLDLNGERKEVHGWNASGTQDDRYGLNWVCTYGTSHPGRWSVQSIGRDALGIRRGKLPRSTICEMQARNRSFGICKLWEHGVGRVGWQI